MQVFVQTVHHSLRERGITIGTLIEFTDGCAVQYKSKVPFADIAESPNDFGYDIHRNFFCPRHGKGPSDGVGGYVKSMVTRAVAVGDTQVQNATQLCNCCIEKLIPLEVPTAGI